MTRTVTRPPACRSCRLWDFADYNSITTEPVPPLGSATTRMRWYWESRHYKRAVGKLMLDWIFADDSPARTPDAGFGAPLGSGNIEDHMAGIRTAHLRYAFTHQSDIEEINRI